MRYEAIQTHPGGLLGDYQRPKDRRPLAELDLDPEILGSRRGLALGGSQGLTVCFSSNLDRGSRAFVA